MMMNHLEQHLAEVVLEEVLVEVVLVEVVPTNQSVHLVDLFHHHLVIMMF
jgi:hypothetical protein